MSKIITFSVVIFISLSIVPISDSIYPTLKINALFSSTNGNILHVGGSGPNNYTTINEALQDASNGDTIFVYPGIYHERLSIKKSINLIGKNRNTTIIDGRVYDVVTILADSVIISGFTIQNSGSGANWESGINVQSSYNTIIDSIITKNYDGILIEDSNHNVIAHNVITENYDDGIHSRYSNSYNNHIFSNIITYNKYTGIRFSGVGKSYNNNISGNILSNNDDGICAFELSNSNISGNILSNSGGISLSDHSNSNYIYGNSIIPDERHSNAIYLEFSFYNRITHNNFMKDSKASFYFSYFYKPSTNNWDGNYWGRPRILPKPIVGWWAPFLWLNFDWHPALKPYRNSHWVVQQT